jgi:hypothetical protein
MLLPFPVQGLEGLLLLRYGHPCRHRRMNLPQVTAALLGMLAAQTQLVPCWSHVRYTSQHHTQGWRAKPPSKAPHNPSHPTTRLPVHSLHTALPLLCTTQARATQANHNAVAHGCLLLASYYCSQQQHGYCRVELHPDHTSYDNLCASCQPGRFETSQHAYVLCWVHEFTAALARVGQMQQHHVATAVRAVLYTCTTHTIRNQHHTLRQRSAAQAPSQSATECVPTLGHYINLTHSPGGRDLCTTLQSDRVAVPCPAQAHCAPRDEMVVDYS